MTPTIHDDVRELCDAIHAHRERTSPFYWRNKHALDSLDSAARQVLGGHNPKQIAYPAIPEIADVMARVAGHKSVDPHVFTLLNVYGTKPLR